MPLQAKKSWMKDLNGDSSLEYDVFNLLNLANGELLDLFFFGNFSMESFYGPDCEKDFVKELKDRGISAIKLQEKLSFDENESSSEEAFTVWGFYRGEQKAYVKFQGFYTSYDGAEYQQFKLVKPKQKTITVYE